MHRLIFKQSIITLSSIILILIWVGSIIASERYELVAEWGSPGSENGQFYEAMGLAIDNEGNLYLSDFMNDNVQKFTSEGDFITKWGSSGSGDGEFIGPYGIDVDDEGNVYVAEFLNDRVQKFTSEGDFITKWSTRVEGIWMYGYPQGIAVDNAGFVYVHHTSITLPSLIYGCIQKFTSEGDFIKKWPFLFGALELATDSEGNLYVPGVMIAPVQKFSSNGELVDQWTTCSIEEVFCSNAGIAIDDEGNVYVSDMIHHCVKKFTKDGELITSWELEGSGGFGSEPSPCGLAVDNEGYVYVSDISNDRIQKYAKVSDTTTTITTCPAEELYGEYAEETELLRHFRDNVLSKTAEGQEVIRLYYQWSPAIVKAMVDEVFKGGIKKTIDGILPLIRTGVE